MLLGEKIRPGTVFFCVWGGHFCNSSGNLATHKYFLRFSPPYFSPPAGQKIYRFLVPARWCPTSTWMSARGTPLLSRTAPEPLLSLPHKPWRRTPGAGGRARGPRPRGPPIPRNPKEPWASLGAPRSPYLSRSSFWVLKRPYQLIIFGTYRGIEKSWERGVLKSMVASRGFHNELSFGHSSINQKFQNNGESLKRSPTDLRAARGPNETHVQLWVFLGVVMLSKGLFSM